MYQGPYRPEMGGNGNGRSQGECAQGFVVHYRKPMRMQVAQFVFSHLVYCFMCSLMVALPPCLLDLSTPDLHPVIILATTVNSFHTPERHICESVCPEVMQ